MRFCDRDIESIRSSTKAFLELVATRERLAAYGAGSSSTYLVQGLLFRWSALRKAHLLPLTPAFSGREKKALNQFEAVLKTLPQSLPPTESATEEFLETAEFERIPLAAWQCLAALNQPSATRFFQRVAGTFWRSHPVAAPQDPVLSPAIHGH